MNRRVWIALTGFGVPLAAAAFITCVGDDAAVPPVDPDAATVVPESSTTPDAGGSDGGGLDAAVDSGIDPAACAARTVNEATAVFVYINGNDTPTCGGASLPCQTVQAGLDQAKTLGRSVVYVARGTYKESVKLAAGITLEGGWDTLAGKWIPACGNDTVTAVKLQMPDTTNVVVTADFTGAATMRFLSVLGKATAPATGESVYGVFAKGSTLTFEGVAVNVGPAGAGGAGTAGGTGSTGATKCATGPGGAGTAGTVGAPGSPGVFGPTGYTPSTGSPGLANGTKGGNGTCTAACGGSEFTICTPGAASCGPAKQGCANPLAGCGGSPGTGGNGGGGGGSCVAVFGWDATFNVSGGAFVGGNAGNGGDGGAGGSGGPGGGGTTEQELCASCISGNNCATVGNTTLATGGVGAMGGAGGVGGGGAGGFSYGIYAGGPQGKLNVVKAPLLQHGAGGAAGPPNGAAGDAGDKFP